MLILHRGCVNCIQQRNHWVNVASLNWALQVDSVLPWLEVRKKLEEAFIHTLDEDSCAEVPSVGASRMPTTMICLDIAASNASSAKEKHIMASSTATQSPTRRNNMDFNAKDIHLRIIKATRLLGTKLKRTRSLRQETTGEARDRFHRHQQPLSVPHSRRGLMHCHDR